MSVVWDAYQREKNAIGYFKKNPEAVSRYRWMVDYPTKFDRQQIYRNSFGSYV